MGKVIEKNLGFIKDLAIIYDLLFLGVIATSFVLPIEKSFLLIGSAILIAINAFYFSLELKYHNNSLVLILTKLFFGLSFTSLIFLMAKLKPPLDNATIAFFAPFETHLFFAATIFGLIWLNWENYEGTKKIETILQKIVNSKYFLPLVLLIFLIIYLANFSTIRFADTDEGRILYDSYAITIGKIPFVDFDARSPLMIYFLAGFTSIFGNSFCSFSLSLSSLLPGFRAIKTPFSLA